MYTVYLGQAVTPSSRNNFQYIDLHEHTSASHLVSLRRPPRTDVMERSCFIHWIRFSTLFGSEMYTLLYRCLHYNDVIMSVMASQITSLTVVYSTVYSGAHQTSKLRVTGFCEGNSPITGAHLSSYYHKESKVRKYFALYITVWDFGTKGWVSKRQ